MAAAPPHRYDLLPATEGDVAALIRAGGHDRLAPLAARPQLLAGLVATEAWTLLKDLEPVAAAGIVPIWNGRYQAWFLAGRLGPRDWWQVTARIRDALPGLFANGVTRLEVTVEDGFAAGRRWAARLGFEADSDRPLKRLLPDGSDGWLYSAVDGEGTRDGT